MMSVDKPFMGGHLPLRDAVISVFRRLAADEPPYMEPLTTWSGDVNDAEQMLMKQLHKAQDAGLMHAVGVYASWRATPQGLMPVVTVGVHDMLAYLGPVWARLVARQGNEPGAWRWEYAGAFSDLPEEGLTTEDVLAIKQALDWASDGDHARVAREVLDQIGCTQGVPDQLCNMTQNTIDFCLRHRASGTSATPTSTTSTGSPG